MLDFVGTCLGVALLIGGGTLLVRGASELATRFGISPMVVGLTIVGFGTSAPELVVNAVGALRGETALAFGNVIGSNISNLGLVLGLAAIIAPISIHGDIVRREVALLLLATTIMTVMALDGVLDSAIPMISRTDSIVLLLLFCIFVYIIALDFFRAIKTDQLLLDIDHSPVFKVHPSSRLSVLLVVGGLILLFVGGEMTIRYASSLAVEFGVSSTIIGLFVVAIGTSMPELVTSIIAALRGESDLALGNVIGSNLFNSLLVLPMSGLIAEIPIPAGGISDLLMSLALTVMLLLVFFFGRRSLGRTMGVVLVLAYIAYASFRVISS